MALSNTSKQCTKCSQDKPLWAFTKYKTGRYSSWCKECKAFGGRLRYSRFTEEDKQRRHKRNRAYYLSVTYGITLEEYDSMLETQGGGRAICGTSDPGWPGKGSFHVDHNHETGEVRGLLCNPCNRRLVSDHSPDLLRKAAEYLEHGVVRHT